MKQFFSRHLLNFCHPREGGDPSWHVYATKFTHLLSCAADAARWIPAFAGMTVIGIASAYAAEPTGGYLYQLTYTDAESSISDALVQKGAGQIVQATIQNRSTAPMYSYAKPVSVEIRGLQFDKNTNRWQANLLFNAEGQVVSVQPVAGRFDEMTEVPMLKHPARLGDVIAQNDIEVKLFPVARTRSDTITDLASLIGKTPSRSISPMRPIRTQELQQPSIVKKNAMVTMRYEANGISINTNGQALSDGFTGQMILVRNIASKTNVSATVIDMNNVAVLSPGTQATQASIARDYAVN